MRSLVLGPMAFLLTSCILLDRPPPVPATADDLPGVPATVESGPEVVTRNETADIPEPLPETGRVIAAPTPDHISPLCEAVGNKLGSVSVEDCHRAGLKHDVLTPGEYSLAYRDFEPGDDSLGRVLIIGGIHGDEFSSVSLMFRWMEILEREHAGRFHFRFVPLANPDGLLREKSQRQNDAGVDLNRNFPTRDWDAHALRHWKEVTYHNPRRNPGAAAASETETQWLVAMIEAFAPDAIVSVHAPHDLVDYDGPPTAPRRLGGLDLSRQGIFPGSLGNYAGHDLGLPVVTVELTSAGIMPSAGEINGMWVDLLRWLDAQLGQSQLVKSD